MKPIINRKNNYKHLTLALALGVGMSAGITQAASLDVDFQATVSSQNHAVGGGGEARYYNVSVHADNPGTGAYRANIPGTNDPAAPFVRNFDGPVVAYKFTGGSNDNIDGVDAQGGDTDSIVFTTTDTTFDRYGQQQGRLWTSNDPGHDLQVSISDPANGSTGSAGGKGGWRSLNDATCTIDVTALAAGSVHIYYGDYGATPTLSLVMRDTDGSEPDITIADAHLNGDAANSTEYYLAEIDFVTDGVYDEVEFVWTSGTGNGRGLAVVVTDFVADADIPTLAPADIVDNVSGGPFTSTGDSITYTVNYSEFMDPATIDASDFELTGTAAATIDSVVHYGGVTTIVVTPTSATSGTLVLQVKAGAVLADLAGNPLDTTSAIADDPAITIVSDVTAPELVSITDNVSEGPILEGQTIVYTVTFDEPMNASSIGTDDFENGGSPAGTINSVSATANPAVYEVSATSAYPAGVGTFILQIKVGATIEDPSGNPLDTGSALPDDTTIIVNAQEVLETVTLDSFLAIDPNQNDSATMTYDASGSDKLVIIATKEGSSTPFNTLTYEGEPLILAVSTGSDADNKHWNGIYYLDNPGSYDNGEGDMGEIVAKSGSSRNIITAVGLSNTAPGFGGVAAPPAPDNSKSVDLGVNFVDSMVIVSHGMGQSGNTADPQNVNAVLPLIEMSAIRRSSWVGHWTGYVGSQGPGLNTYSVTGGNSTGCNTIAAEFPGALVGSGSDYENWGDTFPGLTDGDPNLDFDGGGLETGIEWVVGGDPSDGSDDAGLAPTLDNTTDPDFFIYTYIRTDAANDDIGNTTIKVEYCSDLSNWTTAVAGADIIITESDLDPGVTDTVEVKIRRTLAVGGKLFARFNVVIVP
jgi:hypothetical protein